MDDIRSKRVGIVGLWTENNFGAVLTAWALYRILENEGYEPVFLEFENGRNNDTKAGEFIRSNCNYNKPPITTLADAAERTVDIDTFIVGSDQCWRGDWITELYGFRFFLNFTPDSKRRISYATSCGVTEFEGTEEEKELAVRYLKRFAAISMREKNSARLYGEKLGRDIAWTIDPVFLIDREYFVSMTKKASYVVEDNTVLGFFLDIDREKHGLLNEIGSILNKNVQIMFGEGYTNVNDIPTDSIETEASVYDFVNAIYKCSYVVTDSYHAMCFAIIFHKPFTVVINERRGAERFTSILEETGLPDHGIRITDAKECADTFVQSRYDWSTVDVRFEKIIRIKK